MFSQLHRRLNFTTTILLIYLVSTTLLSALSLHHLSTLFGGLLATSLGATATFLLSRQWEHTLLQRVREKEPPGDPFHSKINFQELENALAETQEKYREVLIELDQKTKEFENYKKEQEESQEKVENVSHELSAYQSRIEEESKRKTVLLSEYQETINQQREVIKKKQQQISDQESKIHDLNYEVKTLLQLADMTNGEKTKPMAVNEETVPYQVSEKFIFNSQIASSEAASKQLRRCLDIAQKITGSHHFSRENSRFKDLSIDNYALDLRRLFDSLQSENNTPVFVYSQKENRLLFANHRTKELFGWSADKFVQNFPHLIQEGKEEWQKGLSLLSAQPEANVRLLLKARSGQNVLTHCHFGIIASGIFRHHVIGILYPA